MLVTVKLFASLARYSKGGLPGTPFEFEIPEGTTLLQLVDSLEIPSIEAKVVFVNGLIKDLDWVLHPADEVGIFPPIGGG